MLPGGATKSSALASRQRLASFFFPRTSRTCQVDDPKMIEQDDGDVTLADWHKLAVVFTELEQQLDEAEYN